MKNGLSAILILVGTAAVSYAAGTGDVSDGAAVRLASIAPLHVKPGDSVEIEIPLVIASDVHVQGNPASNEFLVPLELVFASTKHVSVAAIRYPSPETYLLPDSGEELLTYHDTVTVTVVLAVGPAAMAGPLTLVGEARYQACGEGRCLFPDSVPIAVDVNVSAACGC